MKKARIIQIGANGFGKFIAHAVKKCSNIDFMGLHDVNSDSLEEVAGLLNVKPYYSLEEVLSSDCDGVILEVPNDVHLNLGKAAASANKHICIDKPITNTVKDAAELVKFCYEQGVLLQVGHSTRFMNKYRKVKELLNNGAIGRIVMVEANYSSESAKSFKGNGWRCFRNSCPGGPVMQLGIHCIDTIYYITGCKPLVATGFFSDSFTAIENEDAGMIVMKLEKGILAYVGSSYVSPSTSSMIIYGDNGKIEVGQSSISVISNGSTETVEVAEEDEFSSYIRQFESFATCILTKSTPECDGETGLQNLWVIEEALKKDKYL